MPMAKDKFKRVSERRREMGRGYVFQNNLILTWTVIGAVVSEALLATFVNTVDTDLSSLYAEPFGKPSLFFFVAGAVIGAGVGLALKGERSTSTLLANFRNDKAHDEIDDDQRSTGN